MRNTISEIIIAPFYQFCFLERATKYYYINNVPCVLILNCQLSKKAVAAWCRWRLKLSSSLVHLTSTASPAAVPSHILGVLKLPPDNASTSVYSTLLPPCPRHVTEPRVGNMATYWRSWTRGTCQCVLEVELSYVKLTSSCHNPTACRSCCLSQTPKIKMFSKIFLLESKVWLRHIFEGIHAVYSLLKYSYI